MHIQVFSPHFDDATLSCGEHILRWHQQGHTVEVVNVFTEFDATIYSADSLDFMRKGKVKSGKAFRDARGKEDTQSMHVLGVNNVQWLGLTDGGFREEHGVPTYPSHDHLFAGKILDSDDAKKKIAKEVHKALKPGCTVVVPLGVGQHADHTLVRNIVSDVVDPERLVFYVDIPYAFQLGSWNSFQLASFLQKRKSVLWSSAQKIEAVEVYHSQVPILFKVGLWQYPECCISQTAL